MSRASQNPTKEAVALRERDAALVREFRAKLERNAYDGTPVKVCGRCKIKKPAYAFCRNKRSRDGLYFYCRHCVSKYYYERQYNQLSLQSARLRWER